jgi:hypothetical protein
MWMSESAETAHFYNMYCSFEVFGLHVSTVEPGWSFPAGQHNLFELKLMLTGAQLTQIGEHAYLQNPGDLLIINPDEVHQSHAHGAEPSTSVVFHFNLDMPLFRETLIRNNQVLYPAGSRLSEKIRTRVDALKDMVLQDGNRIRMMAELMDAMAVLSEEFEQDQVRMARLRPIPCGSPIGLRRKCRRPCAIPGVAPLCAIVWRRPPSWPVSASPTATAFSIRCMGYHHDSTCPPCD